MKKFSVHPIYLLIITTVLIALGYGMVREILDHSYVMGRRRFGRALFWYAIIYGWYKWLVSAYKVEITENSFIKATSFLRKYIIRKDDIEWVKNGYMAIVVKTKKEKIQVSPLIDGVANIKSIFSSTTYNSLLNEEELQNKIISDKKRNLFPKILIGICLAIYAIYIEYIQWTMYFFQWTKHFFKN